MEATGYCMMPGRTGWPWIDEKMILGQRGKTDDSHTKSGDTQCGQTNKNDPVPVIYGKGTHNKNT